MNGEDGLRLVRSRQETRAAILGYLWCSGGSFRPDLAQGVALTEASISRIISDLKAEGVIQESRRAVPYRGGPSQFVTLSSAIAVAAIEISNNRLYAAIGTLAGETLYAQPHELPDGLGAPDVSATIARTVGELGGWATRNGIALEQLAVSIPGYDPESRASPIVALDAAELADVVQRALPGTPTRMTNSMVARAVGHRLQMGTGVLGGSYFFVFVGHGVGAAIVDELAESGDVETCEIGHVVIERGGRCCRCGHGGCLEPYVSTVALADILRVQESELIGAGDRWPEIYRISSAARAEIRARLARLGLAIGNALNLNRQRNVVIAGWPSALPAEDRAIVMAAIGESRLGGLQGITLSFSEASLGREPQAGLALAAFSFIRRSGARRAQLKQSISS
ncbi:putative repressor (ATPase domain and DNA-binding domain) [Bradyrhizobium sp. ORS 278]|uniref:ROK family transcriptional regulator n=1 Tax=Bradyrhizobium sp. (strain ORS 278) TaxID=114615 RepID=UPI0001507EED|nr:ROK family transcriptional regulator [Bradyrhizobium sp. ORS 278]CAL75230.1 putative repressor (ATPase domain and DNA-binding domain) [Bradyrhizobium sp. ORS 278]